MYAGELGSAARGSVAFDHITLELLRRPSFQRPYHKEMSMHDFRVRAHPFTAFCLQICGSVIQGSLSVVWGHPTQEWVSEQICRRTCRNWMIPGVQCTTATEAEEISHMKVLTRAVSTSGRVRRCTLLDRDRGKNKAVSLRLGQG
jgi:hypothetical protein